MTWIIVGCLILLFGAVVVRGAPFVPTHRRTIRTALHILPLQPGDTIIDLGSGDGGFLKAAAKQGYRAVGYEINPLLCLLAWIRCLHLQPKVTIKLRDFWLAEIPPETKAVYVFLAGPYMKHLQRKLAATMAAREEPLIVISYGFAIPGYLPKKISEGLYMYQLKPGLKQSLQTA